MLSRVHDWLLRFVKSDWILNLLGILSFAVVIAVLFIALGTSGAVSAVDDGNTVQGCRSSYAALVTDARTQFDIARSDRDSVRAEADTLLLQLARAAILGDSERVEELDDLLVPVESKLVTAEEKVDRADAHLIAANDDYQAAIERSNQDRDEFVQECRTDGVSS